MKKKKFVKKRFHCKAVKQVSIPLSSENVGVVNCDAGRDEVDRFLSSL